MKEASIATLKNELSRYVAICENGEEIVITRRNKPVARIVPIDRTKRNRTKLGCGKGTVDFLDSDLSDPFIPNDHWDMNS